MKISKKRNNSIWFKFLLFVPLLVIFTYLLSLYPAVGNLSATLREPVSLKTFVDDLIPFNIYFLIPYLLWLLFPISGIILVFYRKISSIQLISLYFAQILLLFSCYIIYLIFPTTATSVMHPSLEFFYKTSVPYNAFPSYHVAAMVFLSFFLYKNWRTLFWISLPITILASIATVFIKFHFFVDIPGGIAMGIFGYYILYEKVALRYMNRFLVSGK
ncbi:MAG: phosphatase PAP2 family protein [archaeon]